MTYYCRLCQVNEVENPGDICELCALTSGNVSPQPQTSQGTSRPSGRRVLVGNAKDQTFQMQNSAAQAPADPVDTGIQPSNPVLNIYNSTTVANPVTGSSAQNLVSTHNQNMDPDAVTAGIIRNITKDMDDRGNLAKWFDSLITGVPYSSRPDLLIFQVYPDFSSSALNAQGNACDQVVVYGTVMNGSVNDSNDVEIYGKRDKANRVICTRMVNKASGVTIVPKDTISATAVRVITAVIVVLVFVLILSVAR